MIRYCLILLCLSWSCALGWRSLPAAASRRQPRLLMTATSSVTSPALPDLASGDKTFFIETHGCQMNLADSDIVRAVLLSAGYRGTNSLEGADLILTNTCAIRDNAEAKVYHRLKYFASLRKKHKKAGTKAAGYPLVGLLGCMAERLKGRLLEDTSLGISFIAGPDSYRDLPDLLLAASTDQRAASTALRVEETYADIAPVREAEGGLHAFVTITRGCNNMCAFCVVPYTRGRERSRDSSSVLEEVCRLAEAGYREVVLLGQNVNSYHDRGEGAEGTEGTEGAEGGAGTAPYALAEGFSQKWRPRAVSAGEGEGVRFGELLQRVAEVDPEMRVRFQAPHPKDFPDDVLSLIAASPNICKALHMPAQHGSSSCLERMQRGYSREAYAALVRRARGLLGAGTEGVGMGLSTDLIAGFCGETEEEHAQSLSLIAESGFDQAFTYAYSRREQTYAGLFLQDDVPEPIKARRLSELVEAFQRNSEARNSRLETGRLHCVLVEGRATKPSRAWPGLPTWTGRTDSNKRVVFPEGPLLRGLLQPEAAALAAMAAAAGAGGPEAMWGRLAELRALRGPLGARMGLGEGAGSVERGKYIAVKVVGGKGHTLRALPLAVLTQQEAAALRLPGLPTAADLSGAQ